MQKMQEIKASCFLVVPFLILNNVFLHCSHRPAEVEGRPQGGDGVAGRQHLLAAPVAPADVERVVDDARGRLGQLGGDGGVAAGTKKDGWFLCFVEWGNSTYVHPLGAAMGEEEPDASSTACAKMRFCHKIL